MAANVFIKSKDWESGNPYAVSPFPNGLGDTKYGLRHACWLGKMSDEHCQVF